MQIILSEARKTQFHEQFFLPAQKLFESGLIRNPNIKGAYFPEAKIIKNSQRSAILSQGRADFEINYQSLSPTQKTDLYCYYYFQMHFSSSFLFYLQELDLFKSLLAEKTVWFVDIGCGPFTSGLAFNSLLAKFSNFNAASVNYIGIDTSKNMIVKAQTVVDSTDPIKYSTTMFFTNKDYIVDIPNVIMDTKNEIVIILNYSYVFASNSLDVDDFILFTTSLLTSYCNPHNHVDGKMIIMQQNPDNTSLNKKWIDYKRGLPMFTSKSGYPQSLDFTFDDEFGSCNYPKPAFTVRCDLLKSF